METTNDRKSNRERTTDKTTSQKTVNRIASGQRTAAPEIATHKSGANKIAAGPASEREIVLQILMEHARTKRYSNVLVRQALDAHPELTTSQKAFVKRLSEGTMEREMELDSIIRRHLNNPKTSMKLRVRCILRMAVYEIYYMDSVTDYAAVNEAVSLLQRTGLPQLSGFVNAILRRICQEKAAMGTVTHNNGSTNVVVGSAGRTGRVGNHAAAAAHDVSINSLKVLSGNSGKGMATRYSMPEEVVSLWLQDYGQEVTQKLLASMLEIRPVCIRFDARVSAQEREELLQRLQEAGAICRPGHWLPYAYTLEHTGNLQALPGFAEGKWIVQDESSMLVCEAAGLNRIGGRAVVLDLCAAPGGKSLHAASLVPDGIVYSFDLSRARTDIIRENARRMKLDNLVIEEHDATQYNPAFEEKADVVLCDVPCSGLGVMTRKKDIKYHFSTDKIRSLAALQKRILQQAVRYVKPGGVLIYSTCTIDKLENNKNATYIADRLNLSPDPLAPYLPAGIPEIHDNQLQLFPYQHHTDGFYIARFRKKMR